MNEARVRLAAQQAALASALLAGSEPPAGFDSERVRAAAEALARKRRRSAAQAWPATTFALGAQFGSLFEAYAANHSLPREGGPLADGESFTRWLEARHALPAAGRIELLAVRLRFRRVAAGLIPRKGFSGRVAWLPDRRRLIFAFRLAGRFERWFSLPMAPAKVPALW